MKKSEFFSFFNLTEVETSSPLSPPTLKKVKPGGFQEHIDMEFYVNEYDELEKAVLLLDREWIGDDKSINSFGKDIAKSFIDAVTPSEEKKNENNQVKLLTHFLFNLKGSRDIIIPLDKLLQDFDESNPKVKAVLDVYRNLNRSVEFSLEYSKFFFENIVQYSKPRLLIEWNIKK